MNKPSQKIAVLAVFMALSLILSYIESLISFGFVFPGFKIGLSNVAVVIILYLYGAKYAAPFGITKSILSLLFLGRLSSMLFSVLGMVFSLAVMIILKQTKKFSIYSVSICGAVFHVWGQIFAAAIFIYSNSVFAFLPWLSLFAVLSGFVVGVLSNVVFSRIFPILTKK